MSLTYERPSARTLNGRSPGLPIAPTSVFSTPVTPVVPVGSYTGAELTARTDVPYAALSMLAASRPGGRQRAPYEYCPERCPERCPEECDEQRYTAIDVVRFAVLDRLMRSGVPVARAAALVQEAETLANTSV